MAFDKTSEELVLQGPIISTTHSCGGHIGFTGILSFYGSLPRFQLEDGSDQTAQWIDVKFANYVDLTPI
jgi:hypothetical protein